MGCASRVTPGSPHNDSLSTVLPIETSPPGIHTMCSGAGAGGGVLFETVGANAEPGSACSLAGLDEAEAEPSGERNRMKAPMPAAIATAANIHHIPLGRE